jgi:hypothetical protein
MLPTKVPLRENVFSDEAINKLYCIWRANIRNDSIRPLQINCKNIANNNILKVHCRLKVAVNVLKNIHF